MAGEWIRLYTGTPPASVFEGWSGTPIVIDDATDVAYYLKGNTPTPIVAGGGGGGITELTTDVVAGPGAGVQVATIQPNVVTYAKMQDVTAASRVLGRGSAAGAGDPQELTLGAGLSMVGTVITNTIAADNLLWRHTLYGGL